MRILFVARKCLPIQSSSLDERPLGGTETALIRLSEVLAQREHEVSIVSSPPAPNSNAVKYYSTRDFSLSFPFDCVVCVKEWQPLFLPIRGLRYFFWTGDGFDQYINFGLGDKRVIERLSAVLAVSSWQADTLCERSGFPREKVSVIKNAIHLPYFLDRGQRSANRLIYSAAPHRGLALVPAIYSKLKEKHPELELHVFSGLSIYDSDRPYQGPEVDAYRKLCSTLQQLPNCVLHGNVKQAELAREMLCSALFIYPNISYETSCISAIEAMAAGCPVVCSAISALPETVGDCGGLIEGTPGSVGYMESFINVCDRFLSDRKYWEEMSIRAIERVRKEYTWEHVADRFEQAVGEQD